MDTTQVLPPAVSRDVFCETLSRFPSGVTVVTARTEGGTAHGTTVSAFCSLSLDPPLVLVALNRRSNVLRHLRATGRFGVNVLAADQQQIGIACGRSVPDKLSGVPWHDDELPRIDGTAAWIVCDVYTVMPGGDHLIVVGLVARCEAGEPEALIVHQRGFRRLARYSPGDAEFTIAPRRLCGRGAT